MKNVLDPTSEENRFMEKELKEQLKKEKKNKKVKGEKAGGVKSAYGTRG